MESYQVGILAYGLHNKASLLRIGSLESFVWFFFAEEATHLSFPYKDC